MPGEVLLPSEEVQDENPPCSTFLKVLTLELDPSYLPSFLPSLPFFISFFPTWVVSKDNKIALFLWTPIEAKATRARSRGGEGGEGGKANRPTAGNDFLKGNSLHCVSASLPPPPSSLRIPLSRPTAE